MDKKHHMAMNSSVLLIISSLKASCVAYCIPFLLPLPFSKMMVVICVNVHLFHAMKNYFNYLV